MNSTMTRRTMLRTAIPSAAALATVTAGSAAIGASTRPMGAVATGTVPVGAFRALIASRREAIRQRTAADVALHADPESMAAQESFDRWDNRLCGVEDQLTRMTLKTCGQNGVRIDDVIIAVVLGENDRPTLAVIDLPKVVSPTWRKAPTPCRTAPGDGVWGVHLLQREFTRS